MCHHSLRRATERAPYKLSVRHCLDRLKEAQKDTHTATTFGTKKGSQRWTLDVLGNWKTLEKELGTSNPYGDAGELETRLHNEANEITNRFPSGSSSTTPDLPFVYDDAGNLRDQKISSTTTDRFTHDAWNRLVKHVYVFSGTGAQPATDTVEYEYNGLHWRTIKKVTPAEESSDTEESGGGTGGTLRTMYYSAAWQLIEERIDDDVTTSPSETRREQEIWGIRYIDDPVMRTSVDPNGDATPDRYYHLTDVQFSTVAMIGMGADPEVVERVRYDAYGKGTHRWGCDITDDGQVNSSDSSALSADVSSGYHLYDSGYDVAMDLNRDGVINSTDSGILSAAGTIAALADGEISSRATTGPDNVFGYDGYVFAPETQRYCVRFRWYDTLTGKWLQRDPAGYVDGANTYSFVTEHPVGSLDPLGLCASSQSSTSQATDNIPEESPTDGCYTQCRAILERAQALYARLKAQENSVSLVTFVSCQRKPASQVLADPAVADAARNLSILNRQWDDLEAEFTNANCYSPGAVSPFGYFGKWSSPSYAPFPTSLKNAVEQSQSSVRQSGADRDSLFDAILIWPAQAGIAACDLAVASRCAAAQGEVWLGGGIEVTTAKTVRAWRVFDGTASKMEGRWASQLRPACSAEAKQLSSLGPWNRATRLAKVMIPRNTRIVIGPAGPAAGPGTGGGIQILILDKIPSTCFKEIKTWINP